MIVGDRHSTPAIRVEGRDGWPLALGSPTTADFVEELSACDALDWVGGLEEKPGV